MSLHPQEPPPIPEETSHVARAAFPKGSFCLHIADELGSIYTDDQFTALFPRCGKHAEAVAGQLGTAAAEWAQLSHSLGTYSASSGLLQLPLFTDLGCTTNCRVVRWLIPAARISCDGADAVWIPVRSRRPF